MPEPLLPPGLSAQRPPAHQAPSAGPPHALKGNCKMPNYLIRCKIKYLIPHQTTRNYSIKTWKFISKAPSSELCHSPAGSGHQSCQLSPKGLISQSVHLAVYMAKCHCSELSEQPLIQGYLRLIFPGTTNY